MKYQFFVIPAQNPGPAQEELNRFCTGRRIINLEKAFVANGDRSFWSVCVTWLEGEKNLQNPPKSRVDYRDVLNEKDFAVFAKLRNLRKSIAEQEGVPVYAVFTNEQLAAMVQKKVFSQNTFGTIDGVGKMRLEKYAEPFLKILRNELATAPHQSTGPNRRVN